MRNKIFASAFSVTLVAVAACFAASLSVCGQEARQSGSDKTAAPVATTVASNASSVLTPNEGDRYRIGPGDILDIRILNRPTISRDAVRVEGNGVIRMPLIDEEIQAACKTEGELAKEIA